MDNEKIRKQKLLLRKCDNDRALRTVDNIGIPSILGESPIEPIEGFIFADRDEYAVFLSFVFKNLSEKALVGLDIRIDFYYYQNIPYCSLDFSYCEKELSFGIISSGNKKIAFRQSVLRSQIESGECFGEGILIPITDIRYTKIKTVLVSARFADGTESPIDIAINGRATLITELDRASRSVFEKGDVSPHLKKRYPSKNIPQFGSAAWLCCCGNKNPMRFDKCEKCHRDRESQEALLSESVINKGRTEIVSDPTAITFHDKSKFRQNKYLENSSDLRKKNDMIEKAIKNVEKAQSTKNGAFGIIFRILYWIVAISVVSTLVAIVYSLINIFKDSYGDEGNFAKFIRKLVDGDFFIWLGDIWPG